MTRGDVRFALMVILAILFVYRLEQYLESENKITDSGIHPAFVNNQSAGEDCDEEGTDAQFTRLNMRKDARIQTLDFKVNLGLNIEETEPLQFMEGRQTVIVTQCVKNEKSDCDYVSDYLVFIGACSAKRPVKVLSWNWAGTIDKIWVAHGPGDNGYPPGRLALHISKNDKEVSFMELRVDSPEDLLAVGRIKRGDTLDMNNFFINDDPRHALVNGVKMKIVVMKIYNKERPK